MSGRAARRTSVVCFWCAIAAAVVSCGGSGSSGTTARRMSLFRTVGRVASPRSASGARTRYVRSTAKRTTRCANSRLRLRSNARRGASDAHTSTALDAAAQPGVEPDDASRRRLTPRRWTDERCRIPWSPTGSRITPNDLHFGSGRRVRSQGPVDSARAAAGRQAPRAFLSGVSRGPHRILNAHRPRHCGSGRFTRRVDEG